MTGLGPEDLNRVDQVVLARSRTEAGETVFAPDTPFHSLYAIRTGFVKTCAQSGPDRRQVTGFHMAGELLGLDGVGARQHRVKATALEDTEVCEIPFEALERLARDGGPLQKRLYTLFSDELERSKNLIMLLGAKQCEQRLATFLLELSNRLADRRFSRSEFVLRMTRKDIGSFLGVEYETVCRSFARFVDLGLIEAQRRHVRILDFNTLQDIASPEAVTSMLHAA